MVTTEKLKAMESQIDALREKIDGVTKDSPEFESLFRLYVDLRYEHMDLFQQWMYEVGIM